MNEKIGVVGAGLMGAEIALVFALAGHDVLLSDRTEAELKTALERLGRVLDRGIGRGFYKEDEKPAALARIRTTTALDGSLSAVAVHLGAGSAMIRLCASQFCQAGSGFQPVTTT